MHPRTRLINQMLEKYPLRITRPYNGGQLMNVLFTVLWFWTAHQAGEVKREGTPEMNVVIYFAWFVHNDTSLELCFSMGSIMR